MLSKMKKKVISSERLESIMHYRPMYVIMLKLYNYEDYVCVCVIYFLTGISGVTNGEIMTCT